MMQTRNSKLLITIVAGALFSVAAQAQTLGLSEAVAIAIEKNPARKMALADTQIAKAQVTLAKSVFFPRVSFSETATVGNDPVYSFGTRLRQARFTEQDFALDRLNFPEPISNFSSRIGGHR